MGWSCNTDQSCSPETITHTSFPFQVCNKVANDIIYFYDRNILLLYIMKTIVFAITILAISLMGCKNHTSHENHDHAHETAEEHAAHAHECPEEHLAHEHESPEEHAAHAHEQESEAAAHAHSDEIIFSKAQAARTTFEVKEIKPSTFNQIIKATGQILPAPGDEAVAVASSNGIVSYASNHIAEGSEVKKGQTIFHIASSHIGEGDYYTKVKTAYETAKANFDRAESLIKDDIISQKEYENTRLEYNNAKNAYDAISSTRTDKGVGIISPIQGHVKNLAVKEGEYVTTGQPLASISQNARLVLRAEVSEKYYSALNYIQSANFKTPYDNKVYALSELNGKLLSHGKTAGENTFYVPVSFEFDNKGDVIPGSFVEIYLISRPIENALAIPVSALTNELGTFYVYVQLDEECYRKQEVTLGANNGKEVQVLKGLKFGDRIVTQGAYQVKMASASGSIPAGCTHTH